MLCLVVMLVALISVPFGNSDSVNYLHVCDVFLPEPDVLFRLQPRAFLAKVILTHRTQHKSGQVVAVFSMTSIGFGIKSI